MVAYRQQHTSLLLLNTLGVQPERHPDSQQLALLMNTKQAVSTASTGCCVL